MSSVAVEKAPVNLCKTWYISVLGCFILWLIPLFLGKYTDVTFPYVSHDDIIQELVGLVGDPGKDRHWCPPISPYIEDVTHLIDPDFDVAPEEDLVKEHLIMAGGSWKPPDCVSRYKVAIVVPFRNRTHHLQQFLSYMHPFLIRQQLDYRIIIVEQSDATTFNRAKLLNIGFVEALKLTKIDCFIFHDVDLLPQNDFNIYACTHQPRHMYSAVDTFRYHLPYRRLFGGAVAVQRIHFTAINGFANRFYGWGGEDDDFYNRMESKGLSIIRFDPQIATYVMLSHQSLPPSDNRFLLLNEGQVVSSEDGLSNLSYELVEKKLMPLYTLLKVMC